MIERSPRLTGAVAGARTHRSLPDDLGAGNLESTRSVHFSLHRSSRKAHVLMAPLIWINRDAGAAQVVRRKAEALEANAGAPSGRSPAPPKDVK